MQSGAIASGAINIGSLGIFTWPIRVNPVNVTTLLVSGGDSFAYGQTNNGVVLNSSPKLFLSTSLAGTVITGFAGGTDGQLLYIVNYGNGPIQFNHLDGTEAAGNKINFPVAVNYLLQPNCEMLLEYDGTNNVWRPAHPTFAAGENNGPVTYGCQWLQQGSGLTYTDLGSGNGIFSVGSGLINSYMLGSGSVASGSVVPGAATKLTQYNGLTTDSYVVVFAISGVNGLHGSFNIRNTSGFNTIAGVASYTDLYGFANSGQPTINPGATYGSEIDNASVIGNLNSGAAVVPLKSFCIALKSNVSGQPAGYNVYLSLVG